MPDITVPPRQRRRPALSCVECRRRKIKCDRRMPCSHCMQLKSTICTFPETHSPVGSRHVAQRASPKPLAVYHRHESPEHGVTSTISSGSIPKTSPTVQPTFVEDSLSAKSSWGSTPVSTPDVNAADKNIHTLVSRARHPDETQILPAPHDRNHDEAMSVLGVNLSSFGDVMLQVGDYHPKPLDINTDRTQFLGRSHWMNTFYCFSRKCTYVDKNGKFVTGVESDEIRDIFERCRRLLRVVKAEPNPKLDISNFKYHHMPPRETADKLVDHYFCTCESIYRILHIPSFKNEYDRYWICPEKASTTFTVQLLIVMAIGTNFYQGDGEDELRSNGKLWVQTAQSAASAIAEEEQLYISSLQIHCLLLQARQISSLGKNLSWITSGNLLRIAFSMGLHRDPKHFPKLSLFSREIRRRLWATVLEMTVLTSIDHGMPALITTNDFDTGPPSNINDEDIAESTTVMPDPKPDHVFTQSTIQILLLRSLRTRLGIVHFMNGFRSESSYDETLRFGQEITKACNEFNRLFQSYPSYLPRPTAMQSILLDLTVRRFLLEVHRPFFLRSLTDPRYYFSRKVCLENALKVFSHSGSQDISHSPPNNRPLINYYSRLKLISGGLFLTILFQAITIVVVELNLQIEEDIASGLPPSAQTKINREPLYQAINDMDKLSIDRIRLGGDNHFKGPVIFNAAIALIHAKANGIPPEQVVPDAAKRSALQVLEYMSARIKVPPEDVGEEVGQDISTKATGSTGETDFGFDLMMPDAGLEFGGTDDGNFGFQIQDLWLFTNWEAN